MIIIIRLYRRRGSFLLSPKRNQNAPARRFSLNVSAEAWIMLPENLAMPEFCVNGDVMLGLDMVGE
jgi:hypothetical protein